MRVHPVGYQYNRDWAIHNRRKEAIATACSVGSAVAGVVKACSSEDSKAYKVANFTEKLFYPLSNYIQYLIFSRQDDVLGDDKINYLIAFNIGKVESAIEKVNPVIKPASTLMETNLQEGLKSFCN